MTKSVWSLRIVSLVKELGVIIVTTDKEELFRHTFESVRKVESKGVMMIKVNNIVLIEFESFKVHVAVYCICICLLIYLISEVGIKIYKNNKCGSRWRFRWLTVRDLQRLKVNTWQLPWVSWSLSWSLSSSSVLSTF